MNNTDYIVEASFALVASWTLKNPTKKPKPSQPLRFDSLLDPLESIQRRTAERQHEQAPPAKVVFAPKNQELGTLVKGAPGYDLLFRELSFPVLAEVVPIYDQADLDERKAMILACTDIYFLRIRNAGQFIIFGEPGLRFLPGKSWQPPKASCSQRPVRRRGKRSKPKLLSNNQRKQAALVVKCISYNLEEESPELRVMSTYSRIVAGAARFSQGLTLNFSNAAECVVGDNLNPTHPLTKGFDPDFAFLKRDADGHNVITNFRNVSIPLFWPNWDDPRLESIRSLESWTERSYESFVSFLEGMQIDSIEDYVPSESSPVERISEETCATKRCSSRDRKGQCYRGDFQAVSLAGPYLLFKVIRGDHTIYLLDSPSYGVALRGFEQKQDALDYIAGGEKRLHAESQALWPKLCHDPNGRWVKVLNSRLEAIAAE